MTGVTWLDDARPYGPVLETKTLTSSLKFARFRQDETEALFRGSAEQAHLIILHLPKRPPSVQSLAGKSVHDAGGPAGSFKLVNLEGGPKCRIHGKFDKVHLHLPQAALDEMADEIGSPRIVRLHTADGGWTQPDPILSSLTAAIIAALEDSSNISELFIDHIMLGLRAHLALRYGGMRETRIRMNGILAPWQVHRAKEYMRANYVNQISVAQVASECGLSPAHFSRAFKLSTGVTPHNWLQTCRVRMARELLKSADGSLAEIALACGFFDQSHFTRVFKRVVGQTPRVWRHVRTPTRI
jgi:AraC family transcriptional regulator